MQFTLVVAHKYGLNVHFINLPMWYNAVCHESRNNTF